MKDFIEELGKKEKHHFILIDPDKQSPLESLRVAEFAEKRGSSVIMVGGSTVKDKATVYRTVKKIKSVVGIPVILFPNRAEAISQNADYIFFMTLMNSLELRLLRGEQLKGAPLVKKWAIKPIPMGYIIVSTSNNPTTVERMVELDRIKETDVEKLVDYALMSEYIGKKCVYLEAGSGAEKPIPNEMISAVKKALTIPVIVGGGIRDASVAVEKLKAGADVIVTGTVGEENLKTLGGIISAIKKIK